MSDKKIVIVSFLMIAFLVLSTYIHSQRTRDIQENGHPVLPSKEFSSSDHSLPKLEDIISERSGENQGERLREPEEIEYKEFIDQDNKITVEYPSHWKVTEDATPLGQDNIDFLFVAFLEGSYEVRAGMTILRGQNLDEDSNLLEKTESTFADAASREILEEKETENGKIFKTKYKDSLGEIRGKEKVMQANDSSYMVSVFVMSHSWEDFLPQTDHIINSATIRTENDL